MQIYHILYPYNRLSFIDQPSDVSTVLRIICKNYKYAAIGLSENFCNQKLEVTNHSL